MVISLVGCFHDVLPVLSFCPQALYPHVRGLPSHVLATSSIWPFLCIHPGRPLLGKHPPANDLLSDECWPWAPSDRMIHTEAQSSCNSELRGWQRVTLTCLPCMSLSETLRVSFCPFHVCPELSVLFLKVYNIYYWYHSFGWLITTA